MYTEEKCRPGIERSGSWSWCQDLLTVQMWMSQYLLRVSVSRLPLSLECCRWACLGNIMGLRAERTACMRSLREVWRLYRFAWNDLYLRFLHVSHCGGMMSLVTPDELAPRSGKKWLPFIQPHGNNSLLYRNTIKQAKNLHRQLGYMDHLLPWPLPRAGNHWLRWSLLMVKCSYKSGELIIRSTFWIK